MRLLGKSVARLWLPVLALAVAGCGLSDYEKRIDEQKKKLEKFDQENKLIGEPLEAPPTRRLDNREEVPGLPVEFFFRAPRGVSKYPDDHLLSYPPKGPAPQVFLCRYGAEKPDRPDAAPVPSPVQAVFISTGVLGDRAADEMKPDEFRQLVLWALFVANGDTPPKQIGHRKYQTGPLVYEALEFPLTPIKDKTVKEPRYHWYCFAYFHQQPSQALAKKVQAAIVFQVPFERKDEESLRKARDVSLRTLGIGDEQEKKHAGYWTGRRR